MSYRTRFQPGTARPTHSSWRSLCLLLACGLGLLSSPAIAVTVPVPAPPAIAARSYLLIDHDSGRVLASSEPELQVEPASITKLMTSYVVFAELRKGDLKMDDLVTVSNKAWSTPGSRMFIEVGSQLSVENLLKGMIIQSGNDASVALAEHLAGSEEIFASLMNQYAQALGMHGTHFENATGLPGPEHYTTAQDVAILARATIAEFPDLYAMFAEKEFTFGVDISTGRPIRQHNRNKLLWRDPAVDGIKTGHTESAGFCLAASARRGGMRLISVVMGSASEDSRFDETQQLFGYGFRFFETHHLYSANQELRRAEVWKGGADDVGIGLDRDLYVTIPRGQYDQLEANMHIPQVLIAPISDQAQLGMLTVTLGDRSIAEVPLQALESVDQGGFWTRMTHSIGLWFYDGEDG